MRLTMPRLRNAITEAQGTLDKFAPPPSPTVKSTATKTRMSDYFTVPGDTRLLYTAEGWVHVRLLLQNAGPVAVGMDQNITPVLSGRGRLLPTGQEIRFNLTRGDRLFIAAESINRVSFTIEPLQPVDRIVVLIESGLGSVRSIASAVLSLLGGK
jgi:hypothetical protein